MTQPMIAVQLYCVRKECDQDLKGTLTKIAAMGYDGVEFAGFHGRSADEICAVLARTGLKIAGAHVPLELLSPQNIEETIAYHAAIGNTYLIVPWLGDSYRGDETVWRETSEQFSRIAAALAPHGMRGGYHNHNFEFSALPDSPQRTAWDIVAQYTPQEFVLQLDTGNALEGGADPVDLLARYPGRAFTIHLKEFPDGLPGDGAVRWSELFAQLQQQSATQWMIVEQEGDAYAPIRYIDEWLQRLKTFPEIAR